MCVSAPSASRSTLKVVLVPLNDGAPFHRRVLDGHQRRERVAAEHETAGVNRQMPRETFEHLTQLREQRDRLRVRVEPDLMHQPFTGFIEVLNQLRVPIEFSLRDAQHLPDFARR
jgi:hypothetical protein